MKDKIRSTTDRVLTHVNTHRFGYGVAVGFTAATTLFYKMDRVTEWNEFLDEKGLTTEFYSSED